MIDEEMDAMMAAGLLHTVREAAKTLYGENQTYPCDDVKRMVGENARLRAALHRISLGSQDSGTTKEGLGREARAALEGK